MAGQVKVLILPRLADLIKVLILPGPAGQVKALILAVLAGLVGMQEILISDSASAIPNQQVYSALKIDTDLKLSLNGVLMEFKWRSNWF